MNILNSNPPEDRTGITEPHTLEQYMDSFLRNTRLRNETPAEKQNRSMFSASINGIDTTMSTLYYVYTQSMVIMTN